MPVVPDALRKAGRLARAGARRGVAETILEVGVDYVLLDTSKPLHYVLFYYLSSREKRIRSR